MENQSDSDSDEKLVARAQGGDREALDLLVRRHQSWVFNLALRMMWRREAAEDAAQEKLSQVRRRIVYSTKARHRAAIESPPS